MTADDPMRPHAGRRMPHADDVPAHDRFGVLLDEIRRLHDAKAHDYSDDGDGVRCDNLRAARELGISPYLGVLLRMNDKMARLKAIARTGRRAVAEETVLDTLKDISVYALLGIILCEEEDDTTKGRSQA